LLSGGVSILPEREKAIYKLYENSMKETVYGDRVLVQAENIYEVEEYLDEKTKRTKKREIFKDFTREAKIIAKGRGDYADQLTVGARVYYLPYGGVEVDILSNKKYRVLCIPADDVFLGL
jgi:hypothetical protein